MIMSVIKYLKLGKKGPESHYSSTLAYTYTRKWTQLSGSLTTLITVTRHPES